MFSLPAVVRGGRTESKQERINTSAFPSDGEDKKKMTAASECLFSTSDNRSGNNIFIFKIQKLEYVVIINALLSLPE